MLGVCRYPVSVCIAASVSGMNTTLRPDWKLDIRLEGFYPLKLQIVKRRQRAFKIIGLTWIVERSFAWLGRNRRLSKDYEYSVQSSETLIEIAATRLMLNRLAQA
jgi:transposase